MIVRQSPCVGILAQDLRNAFARHGVEDKLIMLSTRKLNPDDEDEYYCIEYTHFFIGQNSIR